MTVFALADGSEASYESGLLTFGDGRSRGVETVADLALREAGNRDGADPGLPGALGALSGRLRGALPGPAGLSLPLRLAVSTVRAGLGALAEGLGPKETGPVAVEIAFADGIRLAATMPEPLLREIRRDRALVLAALVRAAAAPKPTEPDAGTDEAAQALTSIFRYEKRNGRLRRVAGRAAPGDG